ncbi:DUF736 domain-containing protein [Microvirga sp. GCM10011540]|uniref:DUF736 domain-containing protein n=1 Tax=Microvirga sp. GCM10011540 TaxID=3317338 RepID=UPI00360DDA61
MTTTNLGSFRKVGTGWTGHIQTLAFKAPLDIIPATDTGSDKAPDFRVLHDMREVGAGWSRTSKKGGEYVSLKLTDPALGGLPIYPVLVEGRDGFSLLLNGREQA